jgi:hypothetical protein
MNLNLLLRANVVLFIIWCFFIYKFDDYMNDILDFEMSIFNINYKKNILYNQYPSYLFRDEHFRFGLVFT